MKIIRVISRCILVLVAALSLGADWFAPHDYSEQFRQHADEPPSRNFALGTDELGRDRLSRLLEGTRISLLCASLAALLATVAATAIGLIAGYFGGWVDELTRTLIDLFLSLPWLFALLSLRALLPLNTSPMASLTATFLFLAAVGWAPGARVIRPAVSNLRRSDSIVHARAYGCSAARLLCVHMLPNLRPVVAAQFWILLPAFLLTEANLGVLGLGINEPLSSWGSLLAELQNYQKIPEQPWILIPAVLVLLVVGSLQFVVSGKTIWE
jgi:ABC-type dipeptide/oligopeptide/nickel transport system permease subunit